MDERLGRLLTHFEWGILSSEESERFEEHIMECDFCLEALRQSESFMSSVMQHRSAIVKSLHAEGISYDALKERLAAPTRTGTPFLQRLFERVIRFVGNLTQTRVLVPVVGVVAVVALFFVFHHPQENQVRANYLPYLSFEKLPYKRLEVRGGQASEAQRFFDAAMDEYINNNFKGAIVGLKEAVEKAPDMGDWRLYLGVSYYLDHQPKPAIEALTTADTMTHFLFKIRTRWYLAQSHLMNDEPAEAIPLLEWIVAQNQTYATKADSLLAIVHSTMKTMRSK